MIVIGLFMNSAEVFHGGIVLKPNDLIFWFDQTCHLRESNKKKVFFSDDIGWISGERSL